MRRWLPYPLLFFLLLAMWLLLTQTFSVGQIFLGSLAALAGTHVMAALRPVRSPIGSVSAIVRLSAVVVADIIRSNFAVAAIVLFPRKTRTSGFVRLPLELQDPHGLALLAIIITATPGTVWVDHDRRNSFLLIHVLDLVDEEEWVRLIKRRYEARLLEIFGS